MKFVTQATVLALAILIGDWRKSGEPGTDDTRRARGRPRGSAGGPAAGGTARGGVVARGGRRSARPRARRDADAASANPRRAACAGQQRRAHCRGDTG